MGRRARSAIVLGLAAGAAHLGAGCSHGHAPFATSEVTDSPRARDAGPDANVLHVGPPPLPADGAFGVCGRTVVPIAQKPVNLYFIVDASGSMTTPIDSPTTNGGIEISRYDAARAAIRDVLLAVGSRVSFGAALFPAGAGTDPNDACPAGGEVYPTRQGDDARYNADAGIPGPQLQGLLDVLGTHRPDGLTPTAAAIGAVKQNLLALDGKTYAFLLTDGAPNCDADANCTAATCTVNIEGSCGQPKNVNCCDPSLGLYDARWCLDGDPTIDAVKDLSESGVATYVIGMPGTEAYATLLDRVAEAGGTARPTEPEYYAVDNGDELSNRLREIGLSVAISCDVTLEAMPPDENLVNVYFGHTIVPRDDKDGWTWSADAGDATITIVGSACDDLKAGRVPEVQVVAGCPSITR
ncbi:MAG TPA: VWA domain-containing protein [Polyangiaceae bacterium]|jgi:hypothetical protein|nr:VWA domain-containing protein [Polyangiaceae bacterium]